MNPVAWTGRDSGWWLVAAGAAFTAAELLFVSPRMGLSWDEVVYVSQVSGHAPAAWFDPARARGVPLLVAPLAALTGSVAALRVYLSVASGVGLALALWTWRRLRPAWLLGLAGLLFGGLWVAQYYGPQAMPDMWSARRAWSKGCNTSRSRSTRAARRPGTRRRARPSRYSPGPGRGRRRRPGPGGFSVSLAPGFSRSTPTSGDSGQAVCIVSVFVRVPLGTVPAGADRG